MKFAFFSTFSHKITKKLPSPIKKLIKSPRESRNSEYLERFFRDLLLGETNELRNRYMVVNAPERLIEEQLQQIERTSTEQPTVQVTEQVRLLLLAMSNEQLSLKVLMKKVGLKYRPTFLENYINLACEVGILKVLLSR